MLKSSFSSSVSSSSPDRADLRRLGARFRTSSWPEMIPRLGFSRRVTEAVREKSGSAMEVRMKAAHCGRSEGSAVIQQAASLPSTSSRRGTYKQAPRAARQQPNPLPFRHP
jgi:hypothetical protein